MLFKKKEEQNTQHNFDSTQKYLEIDAIKDDLVMLKDGSLRAVVMISGINMELRSGQEQAMVLNSYQEALNSLEFPIQILVQSRKVDLTSYLSSLENAGVEQKVPLLRDQTFEYVSFLKNILSSVNVMDKRFFAIVPYYPNVVVQGSKGILSLLGIKQVAKENPAAANYNLNVENLKKRVDTVVSLFGGLNLAVSQLPTEALIELFYACYNPETAGHEHIKNLPSLGASYITKREGVESDLGMQ